MISRKMTLHGKDDERLNLQLASTVQHLAPQAFLSFQLKQMLSRIRKLEPLSFTVKTMQQCTTQQQRLSQLLSAFVDFLHNSILKPYTQMFLTSQGEDSRRPIEAELVLSTWIRCDLVE